MSTTRGISSVTEPGCLREVLPLCMHFVLCGSGDNKAATEKVKAKTMWENN